MIAAMGILMLTVWIFCMTLWGTNPRSKLTEPLPKDQRMRDPYGR